MKVSSVRPWSHALLAASLGLEQAFAGNHEKSKFGKYMQNQDATYKRHEENLQRLHEKAMEATRKKEEQEEEAKRDKRVMFGRKLNGNIGYQGFENILEYTFTDKVDKRAVTDLLGKKGGEYYDKEIKGTEWDDLTNEVVQRLKEQMNLDLLEAVEKLPPGGLRGDFLVEDAILVADCVETLNGYGPELVKYATMNAEDSEGATPLHIAARKGHAEVVKALLVNLQTDTIRDLLRKKDKQGQTPLHEAWRTHDNAGRWSHWKAGVTVAVVNALLEKLQPDQIHAVLRTQDQYDRTPLHLAAIFYRGIFNKTPSQPEVMEALLGKLNAEQIRDLEGVEDNNGKTVVMGYPERSYLLHGNEEHFW